MTRWRSASPGRRGMDPAAGRPTSCLATSSTCGTPASSRRRCSGAECRCPIESLLAPVPLVLPDGRLGCLRHLGWRLQVLLSCPCTGVAADDLCQSCQPQMKARYRISDATSCIICRLRDLVHEVDQLPAEGGPASPLPQVCLFPKAILDSWCSSRTIHGSTCVSPSCWLKRPRLHSCP